MTSYSVQAPVHRPAAGITLVAPGGTTGDLAPTGQGLALLVGNGATPTTVALAPLAFDGMTVTFPAITIAANSINLIPLPPSVYGAGTTAVNFSAVTTVSVCVIAVSVS